jgi:hypothetical protein
MPGITSISRTDYTTLIRQVSGATLFNRQLASICQINGLKSTGVKAELQGRIRDCKFILKRNGRTHQLAPSYTPSLGLLIPYLTPGFFLA